MVSEVAFPGLNLFFSISPICFRIGEIEVHWYAILIVISFIIAMIACKLQDGKFGIYFDDILDLSIYLIPISIISARLYYVIFHLDYFFNNLGAIFAIQDGGMGIYGGIIGGAITCYIFCRKRKINLLDLIDYIVPYLALRTSNWKNRKFYKCRSLWNTNR